MKYFILFVSALFGCKSAYTVYPINNEEAVLGDNSMTSLDWAGQYYGQLPCADCEAINVQIVLTRNGQYTMSTQYQGKSKEVFHEQGSFNWDPTGGNIIFSGNKSQQYKVGENILFKLDQNGQRITGELANNYQLRKVTNTITEKYWKAIEINGQSIEPQENQWREPHFILKEANNRLQGNTGCNGIGATYQLNTENGIMISNIIATKIYCKNIPESAFLQALQNADNYTIEGDTLTLNKAKMAPLAKFVVVWFR